MFGARGTQSAGRRVGRVLRRGSRAALWAGLLAALCFASAADAAGPRLLLLPIVVHSSEDPDYLRAGLSDMLAARFERIGALDLLRAEEDEDGTTDPEEARKVGRELGADYVLYGSFTRFGQGASLDVQCAPVSALASGRQAEPLREIFVHSGSIGEIIPDLDELAGKVSRFARGEAVPSGFAGAGAAAGDGANPQLVTDLRNRVAALEAAVSALRDRAEQAAAANTP